MKAAAVLKSTSVWDDGVLVSFVQLNLQPSDSLRRCSFDIKKFNLIDYL